MVHKSQQRNRKQNRHLDSESESHETSIEQDGISLIKPYFGPSVNFDVTLYGFGFGDVLTIEFTALVDTSTHKVETNYFCGIVSWKDTMGELSQNYRSPYDSVPLF